MDQREGSRTVLVTGANGYIGGAVAGAFRGAGWRVFGLVRRRKDAEALARQEIRPVVGSPDDPSFLAEVEQEAFDVVVSNTEDRRDPVGHFARVRALLDLMGSRSLRAGTRPLAMITSGCKDYGRMGDKHGDPSLRLNTEAAPLDPPAPLAARCGFGASLLAAADAPYDATVLRPTIVYGRASSLYGALFDLAGEAGRVLRIAGDPDAVMHSVHVDDCARAYVALAEHRDRARVAGQAFNIASARYETAREIGDALARSYGLSLEFAATGADGGDASLRSVQGLVDFWQWADSEKLRALTGWRELRPSFGAGLSEYRLAFEAYRPHAAGEGKNEAASLPT